jgi:hypothetical protein
VVRILRDREGLIYDSGSVHGPEWLFVQAVQYSGMKGVKPKSGTGVSVDVILTPTSLVLPLQCQINVSLDRYAASDLNGLCIASSAISICSGISCAADQVT